jgi:prevent-host-death family protein
MGKLRVTSAEFQKGFGRHRETALRQPVTITHHGRDSLVLLAAEEYQRLKRRDREVLGLADFTDDDLRAVAEAELAPEAAAFDHELKR